MGAMFDSIKEDIEAFRRNDPAATSTFSILVNSPGMRAIWAYRRHHKLWLAGHTFLARWLSNRARKKFGVEIHPAATIGRRFVIDHGMGIVIGETTVIGDDCMLYQGATLGGTGKETGKRHPTLGNHVVVGVGASVLGSVTIGDWAKVGGGAVVVKDVPPRCTVVGVPGHVTTNCGVRVRRAADDLGERVGPETSSHRQYLPDPIDQTITILEARIAQLERQLREVEGARVEEDRSDADL